MHACGLPAAPFSPFLPAHTSSLTRRKDVWEPWLAQVGDADDESGLLVVLEKAKTIPFLHKSYMDAYLQATTSKCECGKWTHLFNVLLLRPTCWSCFSAWAKTQVMAKTTVRM